MSVLKANRKESKFEALTFSIELHNILIEFMQRDFGIRDLNDYVVARFACRKSDREAFAKYRFLLGEFKQRIDSHASNLTGNVRAANSIFPTTMAEYEQRRYYQNSALVDCERIVKELQRLVEVFKVDINAYRRYIEAIDREIGLIKKWRQKDNKIKAYL